MRSTHASLFLQKQWNTGQSHHSHLVLLCQRTELIVRSLFPFSSYESTMSSLCPPNTLIISISPSDFLKTLSTWTELGRGRGGTQSPLTILKISFQCLIFWPFSQDGWGNWVENLFFTLPFLQVLHGHLTSHFGMWHLLSWILSREWHSNLPRCI